MDGHKMYKHKIKYILFSYFNYASENYVKLQSKSGKWVSFNETNNTLQLVNDLLNDEDGMFELISPCQSSQESDCFSVMPLKRPGWYLR